MLQIELKNCFNRKEFKFIFGLLCLLAVGTYFYLVLQYKHDGIKWQRSSYDSLMMVHPSVSTIYSTIMMLLPIIVGFVYSDCYYRDIKKGRRNYICTRYSEKKYVLSQALAVAIMSFLVIVIPLLINLGLCRLTFLSSGMDNNYALPPYDIGVQNYAPEHWKELFRLGNPMGYYLVRILIIGAVAGYKSFIRGKRGKWQGICNLSCVDVRARMFVDWNEISQTG